MRERHEGGVAIGEMLANAREPGLRAGDDRGEAAAVEAVDDAGHAAQEHAFVAHVTTKPTRHGPSADGRRPSGSTGTLASNSAA